MLFHSQFLQSKYHKRSRKHEKHIDVFRHPQPRPHYGSLSSHKCMAKQSMNKPKKQELMASGLEKIFLLCERIKFNV